uniref:SIR2 family protein n=2 Tax=Clostridium sporogenes TaxID=1509 RepID=UPI0013D38654|nr:SIR2 family protein [Clostridium sporogenes]
MNVSTMIEKIKEANLENKLVIFVGAGVSANSEFKSWQDLIREMDTLIKYSENPKRKDYSNDELLRIPQYLEKLYPEKYLEILRDKFNWLPKKSNAIIDTILELNPHHIITTNFDCLIEYSIKKSEKDQIKKRKNSTYAIVKKDQDLVSVDKNNLVIKMHGDIEAFDSLVLKEKDYLNYSSSHCLIETYIKSLLIDHSFLFVGYGIGDYNLKLILNWFENTVAGYDIDNSKRKSHYFINSNEVCMSQFDKEYFRAKNIEIIDSVSIPKEYKQIEIDFFSDNRGKNIYRTLEYIKNAKPSQKTVHYVFKKLKPFSSCNRIVFQDLMKVLTGYSSSVYKLINDEFHYNLQLICDEAVAVAINALKTQVPSEEEEYIKSVFIKAGVNKLVEDSEKHELIINDSDLSLELYTIIAEKDFNKIYDILNDPSTNAMTSLYLKMFVGANDEVEEEIKNIISSCVFDSLTNHIILLQNGLLCMVKKMAYPTELIDVLSEEEKGYISTICDLNDNFNGLFSQLSSEIIKIQKKYSPYANNNISEYGVQNSEYKNVSMQIINAMKYFICNGLYTFGCYRFTCNLKGYIELLELYVDNLFFFQSSNCEHSKYESFSITKDDLVIITSYMKSRDILLMINKYNIKKIILTKECSDYLLHSLRNVIVEQRRRIMDKVQGEFYLSRIALTICELLKICELSIDDEEYFVETASIIFSITSLNPKDYSYIVISELYSKMLQISIEISWKTFNEKKISCLKDSLLTIMGAFNCEKHDQEYSSVYESLIEPYRVILNICNVLSKHNVIIDDPLIDEFISQCMKYRFYKDSLIDIYPICIKEKKTLIKHEVLSNFRGFSIFYIYMALERQIIMYDETVEKHLIKLCKDYIVRQKIDYSGFWDSPLYAVARLKEKDIIKNLESYQQFAPKDYFFNFVCFPNEFDYNNFDIQWYTWLDIPEYLEAAIRNGKNILKYKFEEAIRNGTAENIRATYYRFFYDIKIEKNK